MRKISLCHCLQRVNFFLDFFAHQNETKNLKKVMYHFQLKFNINNLNVYNLWDQFVALWTECAYAYVSGKNLKCDWLNFPSRRINEIFIWRICWLRMCAMHVCVFVLLSNSGKYNEKNTSKKREFDFTWHSFLEVSS